MSKNEPAPLWRPSESRRQQSQLFAFMQRMHERHGVPMEWEALREWAIGRADLFWPELLEFVDIRPSQPAQAAMSGQGMLGTKWFESMALNFARHMLRFDGDQPALLFEGERGQSRSISQRELREEVARVAAALRREGVRQGDRVAGFMPNLPETVIAMLATASLGAVWSSCSPDFGVTGVLDRFGQIEPVVLIAPDGYSYGGKIIDTLPRVVEMSAKLPSVRRVIVVGMIQTSAAALADRVAECLGERGQTWPAWVGAATPPPLEFAEVPFDHPLYIMYSSGTTGAPKCIVHGHGGTLLQHMKELMLHCDLRAGERIFYFTTCGWMMWNWLVSGLGVGATVVLYEGSPSHPTIHRLWEMAAKHGVHVFGTSPKFLAACQQARLRPGAEHDLSALRAVLSTGSPLSAEQFSWVYEQVKSDVQLASISGGTDIISCFMLGNPLLPVYAGEIQCRGLGMDVQAWDERQRPVVGEKGELICASPFPCQPIGFWNDPDGARYRAAYFEHYADRCVWRHGDYIEITPRGGVIVYGRSDATLNPGGVRIGTAEVYRIVEAFEEVTDCIVVGVDTPDGDVEIALFVVLKAGLALDSALESRLRSSIASQATKRHVPRHIRQVSDIPRTISGKKVELAVRQMLMGQEVKNRDALANPQALDEFRNALRK